MRRRGVEAWIAATSAGHSLHGRVPLYDLLFGEHGRLVCKRVIVRFLVYVDLTLDLEVVGLERSRRNEVFASGKQLVIEVCAAVLAERALRPF